MPRKQRNKSSIGNGSSTARSSATQKSSAGDSNDCAFPPHLIQQQNGHQHHNVEPLVPNAVYVARNALSSKECQEWINYAEGGNNWDKVSHPSTKWIAHRECGRIQKNDWNMSHRLYQRIEQIVHEISPQLKIFDEASLLSNLVKRKETNNATNNQPKKYQPVSCNPNLRLYKYTKGQWFGRHVDESNKIDLPINKSQSNAPFSAAEVKETQTEITVLFYLSSCQGGATRFHLPHSSGKMKKDKDGGIAFVPEEGAVLLHVHGDHCLEHEAEPVLDGVKYVLRTDIVYGIM